MMRDICARFKYSEPSPSPSSAASTPRSVATDRERSGSEQSLDGMVAAADDATPACLPLPTPSNCPPRELIHRCLRRYHREMEAGATDLAAVGERIRDDLAPYSVLKLGGFSLGNVAPKILATVLVKSETLKTLDLGFNRINDRGAALLAKALEQNTSLQSLYLSGNDIGPVGAGSIAAALATNNTLKSLHLSGNNIGEEGIRQLTEGLKKNTGLRALYIGTNGIGSNGMKCIADALQVNQTLEELTLGQNKLCSQGLKHIAAAFATGTVKLTTLEIGKNSIDSEGVIALAKALCNAPNRLQNLYIDNNPIGDTGAGAFGALLAKNAILRVLDLSYTQMSLLGLRDLSVGLSYSTSLLCLLLDGHDWASTQYMKTANGLNGMSLSTKGANNFAASCIIGAINSNAKSLLYKLTGVDLVLVLGSLPINNIDRDYLAGEGVDGIGGRRPMDLVARNERILRYLQDQRAVAAATVNLKRKNEDVQNDTEMTEPQSQRQKTAENYQQLTVDTNAPPRNPAPRPAPTGVPPTVPLNSQRPPLMKASLMRGQNPRHPSWSTDRRLSLKSPRYETTMEVQVRKVIADIPRMPFDADEYAALQTYYLGGCHSPKVPAPDGIGHVAQQSPSSSASALSEKVVEQVPCPACQSSRLARYPRTMVLKARMETKPDSDKQLIVLLRQLHYLVGVFQHVENAEHKIDAILASTHEAREQ